jgi:hypothetical protein
LDANFLQEMTEAAGGRLRLTILVEPDEIVMEFQGLLYQFLHFITSCAFFHAIEAQSNIVFQSCDIGHIPVTFEPIDRIKFHGVVSHHPTDAAVKVLETTINVDTPLVAGDIFCVNEIGQKIGLEL